MKAKITEYMFISHRILTEFVDNGASSSQPLTSMILGWSSATPEDRLEPELVKSHQAAHRRLQKC